MLAGALTALALAGCTTAATQEPADSSASTTPAVATTTPAVATTTQAVAGDEQAEAQQRAEEAEKVMLDPELPPREKYPKALGMFREALAIDPNNALAKESITLIEDIYRSMGRPIPEPT